ncbi:hypothetical protein V8G54_034841 [Vigna mungo]|uniref:Uncharacterized protein n=1 Tax=Vigna mungo TaxID=3915 RepID=A0AAQ3ME03_VIGMU
MFSVVRAFPPPITCFHTLTPFLLQLHVAHPISAIMSHHSIPFPTCVSSFCPNNCMSSPASLLVAFSFCYTLVSHRDVMSSINSNLGSFSQVSTTLLSSKFSLKFDTSAEVALRQRCITVVLILATAQARSVVAFALFF